MSKPAYLPVLGLGLVLGLGTLLNPLGSAAEKADARQIAPLIQQLGSNNFEEREQATKKLAEIGPAALEALRKAQNASDAEVQQRADDLVHRIEEQIRKAELRVETEHLMASYKVHLVFKDTPLIQAVADFQKKVSFALTLENPATLAHRKVTLDTGAVSFWEALDKFCVAAGLAEANDLKMVRAAELAEANDLKMVQWFSITLENGKLLAKPTCHAGLIRLRTLRSFPGLVQEEGQVVIPMEVRAEPGIQISGISAINVEKAEDDKGQRLNQLAGAGLENMAAHGGWAQPRPHILFQPDMMRNCGVEIVPVRLKKADKESGV